MNFLQQFTDYIKRENLFQPKDKLMVALSGGIDSVVLCELCRQAGFNFGILHCNFQLRGEESERDEKFVRELANKYGVEITVKKFDTQKYAEEKKISIQVAARDLRYGWFKEYIYEQYMKSIAIGEHKISHTPGWHASNFRLFFLIAHHAEDNIETLLMNFFKGSGVKGLHGIPVKDKAGYIVRPLLFAKKQAIKKFAEDNKLEYVEDSSNASSKYTRNYFRNELIPGLKKVYPEVEDNLLDNIERFKDIEVLYNQAIELHKQKLVTEKGFEIHIPVLKLQKAEPLSTIVYEIIKDYDFTPRQTYDVIALLKSESGKYIQSSSHRVIRNRKWLIIAPYTTFVQHPVIKAQHILIEENDTEIVFDFAELKLHIGKYSRFTIQDSPSIAQLDLAEIKFPLLLRKWKQGDYFYPLGMQKKKKLSRFFIDQKLSLTQKENVWVIESNKKILWVVGMRIDDRFKITPSTKNILQFSIGQK